MIVLLGVGTTSIVEVIPQDQTICVTPQKAKPLVRQEFVGRLSLAKMTATIIAKLNKTSITIKDNELFTIPTATESHRNPENHTRKLSLSQR